MSHRPFWVSFIQWTLYGLAMWGIASWLGRARKKHVVTGGEVVMTYPPAALIVALICVGLFGAGTVLSLLASAKNAPWWTSAIFGGFLLASLHSLADCWLAKYRLSEEGLEYVSVFSGKRIFRWNELQSLRYAPNMRWFKLENSQGQVARISVMMTGLPEFARLLMERARNVDIDAATIPVLEQTARGEPPSIWT